MGAGKPIYKSLYFQVITGICIGIALGMLFPGKENIAAHMKPFGDAFIKMIKSIIAPIIFCTVVVGIAKMGDMNINGTPIIFVGETRVEGYDVPRLDSLLK